MKGFLTKLIIVSMIISILPFSTALAATPQEVVNIAKQYIGAPYKYGGTTPSGFDCSGFVIYVFNKVGIQLPRTSADQYTVGTAVSKANLEPGDMVFFEKTMSKSGVTHAGIYVGNNQFISATSSSGIKVDSLSSSYWGPKYVGAKRILKEEQKIASGEFKDLPASHPAYEAIHTLNDKNIINGFNDQTFQPEQPVTRGQAAAIINRILQKETKSLNTFKDVGSSNPFAQDISAMQELGVITGFSDGTYRPYDNMTRAEMAIILDRAFKLTSDVTISTASVVYQDVPSGYWAFEAIVALHQIDTTTVFKSDRYNYANTATRAVFSVAIYNTLKAKKL